MREPSDKEVKKDEVLEKCFACLTERGIEKTTTKDFSEATGMGASSLYYWFHDKDEILLDAVEWGLNENISNLFDYAFEGCGNLEQTLIGVWEKAESKKYEFRLIFQVVTSPQYGEHMRKIANRLPQIYMDYTKLLSNKLNLEFDKLYPFISLFISTIVEGIMWDNKERVEVQIRCIINSILSLNTENEK